MTPPYVRPPPRSTYKGLYGPGFISMMAPLVESLCYNQTMVGATGGTPSPSKCERPELDTLGLTIVFACANFFTNVFHTRECPVS